jgi:hypothetical protein
MSRIVIAIIIACYVSGCATAPTPQGQVSNASYVGDRYTVPLDEIMVTMPGNGERELRNLHVAFAAIVNPTGISTGTEYDVRSIIQRAHTRISSALVQDVTAGTISTSSGLVNLRDQVVKRASEVFNTAYSKWSHCGEFKVEIVVVSLYLTNGSVGRSPAQARFWW